MRIPVPDPLSAILLWLGALDMAANVALAPTSHLAQAWGIAIGDAWHYVPFLLMTSAFIWWAFRAATSARIRPVESTTPTVGASTDLLARPEIAITNLDDGGILKDGELAQHGGRSYPIRVKLTGDLADGQAIWIVNENPFTKNIWPQRRCVYAGPGKWEGGTYLSKGQNDVTIVAVVASPTVSDFFDYYDKVRTSHVVEINRLPPECKVVARVRAKSPENI
jgi:hypothetical protein